MIFNGIVWYAATEAEAFNFLFDSFDSDIHTVVKEIATVNNVDLLKVRSMMLEKWICKTGPAAAKVFVSLCFPIVI